MDEQKSPQQEPRAAAATHSPVGFAAGLAGRTARVADAGVTTGRNEGGDGGLPGYIEVRVDAANGRKYYVNHRTEVTSWTPPREEDW